MTTYDLSTAVRDEWDDGFEDCDDCAEPWEQPKWDCGCSRCKPGLRDSERCICPANLVINDDGTRQWHGTLKGNTDGCPIHIQPGCPQCGETWIKSWRWPKCDSCGWTAPIIEEEPSALDLSA